MAETDFLLAELPQLRLVRHKNRFCNLSAAYIALHILFNQQISPMWLCANTTKVLFVFFISLRTNICTIDTHPLSPLLETRRTTPSTSPCGAPGKIWECGRPFFKKAFLIIIHFAVQRGLIEMFQSTKNYVFVSVVSSG